MLAALWDCPAKCFKFQYADIFSDSNQIRKTGGTLFEVQTQGPLKLQNLKKQNDKADMLMFRRFDVYHIPPLSFAF